MLIEPRVFHWNERIIEIRSALPEDAEKLKAHREATAAETHFMARYPEDGDFDLGKMRSGIEGMRDSERAQGLYRKYGFKEYGRTPRAFKLKDGTYRDEIIMVRML